jgi:hypothetical protein
MSEVGASPTGCNPKVTFSTGRSLSVSQDDERLFFIPTVSTGLWHFHRHLINVFSDVDCKAAVSTSYLNGKHRGVSFLLRSLDSTIERMPEGNFIGPETGPKLKEQ